MILKEKFDVKYEFSPFYINPNTNMEIKRWVHGETLFVLLNELPWQRGVYISLRSASLSLSLLLDSFHAPQLMRPVEDFTVARLERASCPTMGL